MIELHFPVRPPGSAAPCALAGLWPGRATLRAIVIVVFSAVLLIAPGCTGPAGDDDSPSPSPVVDADGDGFSPPDDCDDEDPQVHPDATEDCDDIDQDCDGDTDDVPDADQDGYFTCTTDVTMRDCDDGNASRHPGATETCNARDDDCDAVVDEGYDKDHDGSTTCGPGGVGDGDCDDADAAINPTMVESCDGLDNNCDGSIDEGYPDQDADGYAGCENPNSRVDCDDDDPELNPAAAEVCGDAVDDNCDGIAGNASDSDDDGYNTCATPVDCKEGDKSTHPNAAELCDGKDNDCNGRIDDLDDDEDGYSACIAPADCDDADSSIHPDTDDICGNTLDENCDGAVGNGGDADHDGFPTCGTGVPDCDDAYETIYPGAAELCDAKDNDCDGVNDDGIPNDDDYEPNSAAGPYAQLGTIDATTATVLGSISTPADEDWYEFTSIDQSVDFWEIKLTLKDIPTGANYDLYLYKKGETNALGSSLKPQNEEEFVNYQGEGGTDNGGQYLVRVVWKSGGYGCPRYTLIVNAG